MTGPNMITPAQLMRLIGTPDAPVIVDVRLPEDIGDDAQTVPSSIFYNHNDTNALIRDLDGRPAVVICHKGMKLSQGVAALIRAHGGQAEVLTGGFVGWIAAGLPVLSHALIPQSGHWVTRLRPKIDRIACPWLIKRFIAPRATILFVPRSDVLPVADRFDGVAFDADGAPYADQGGLCSFDALLDGFGLRNDPLDKMAQIIRAADTNDHNIAPQAAGLLAIFVGLSKMHRDDTQMLDAGMGVYDALYRWARDGFDEGHAQ